jgi:hypothetical protein
MWAKLKKFQFKASVKPTHPRCKCNQYSLQRKHTKEYGCFQYHRKVVSWSLTLGPIHVCAFAVLIALQHVCFNYYCSSDINESIVSENASNPMGTIYISLILLGRVHRVSTIPPLINGKLIFRLTGERSMYQHIIEE